MVIQEDLFGCQFEERSADSVQFLVDRGCLALVDVQLQGMIIQGGIFS
jgi:hypothetical protein